MDALWEWPLLILIATFPWNVLLIFAIWAVCRLTRRPHVH